MDALSGASHEDGVVNAHVERVRPAGYRAVGQTVVMGLHDFPSIDFEDEMSDDTYRTWWQCAIFWRPGPYGFPLRDEVRALSQYR